MIIDGPSKGNNKKSFNEKLRCRQLKACFKSRFSQRSDIVEEISEHGDAASLGTLKAIYYEMTPSISSCTEDYLSKYDGTRLSESLSG
jgi:hypothetical protein